MLVRTRLIRCSGGILALGAAMVFSLMDIQSASARDQNLGATEFSSRSRHHWRRAPVLTAPVVGVVTGGGLTTALASRSGYHDPYVGYYGGPIYYGGPYYYRPYFDGAGPIYFGTHPIVDW